MGKDQTPPQPERKPAGTPTRLRRFEAPSELPPQFGAHHVSEDDIQGVVATEFVRDLLDAFGLRERTEVTFPFQHIAKKHGEVWRMRIEPAAGHTVDGKPVMGHQWVYVRDIPERVGAAA